MWRWFIYMVGGADQDYDLVQMSDRVALERLGQVKRAWCRTRADFDSKISPYFFPCVHTLQDANHQSIPPDKDKCFFFFNIYVYINKRCPDKDVALVRFRASSSICPRHFDFSNSSAPIGGVGDLKVHLARVRHCSGSRHPCMSENVTACRRWF